jgi:hypothetical protein
MDYGAWIDALIAGEIDVAVFPGQLDADYLRRALDAPDVRLMNVAQAGAIAKTIPGFKRVVLWRGLISLDRDVPNADVDLLATGNSVLVRKDLHPALQYLSEGLREFIPQDLSAAPRFSEQPTTAASPTAERFYRSGPTLWQEYTSFWHLSSIASCFVIDRRGVDPVIGCAPASTAGWVSSHRPIAQLWETERAAPRSANKSGLPVSGTAGRD